MSWHYSQALEAAYWGANSSDGERSVPSNSTTTHAACCSQDKTTDACHRSQSGTTCEPSMESRGVVWWMSYLEASRAKTSAWSELVKDSTENTVDCGGKWPESLARFDRVTSSWKTQQLSLFGGLASFSETWPLWGMMRSGECYPLRMLEHDTSVRGCGSMPTPCRYGNGGTGNTRKLKSLGIDRCKLNPNHQEWLMMWPQGWTELTAPATDKFRLWCESHGIPCGVAEGANK